MMESFHSGTLYSSPRNDHAIMAMMRVDRSRWTIDHNTCQTGTTPRGSGRAFAHHCGYDPKTRAPVLPNLMMLIFLIDQILQILCPTTISSPGFVGSAQNNLPNGCAKPTEPEMSGNCYCPDKTFAGFRPAC